VKGSQIAAWFYGMNCLSSKTTRLPVKEDCWPVNHLVILATLKMRECCFRNTQLNGCSGFMTQSVFM